MKIKEIIEKIVQLKISNLIYVDEVYGETKYGKEISKLVEDIFNKNIEVIKQLSIASSDRSASDCWECKI